MRIAGKIKKNEKSFPGFLFHPGTASEQQSLTNYVGVRLGLRFHPAIDSNNLILHYHDVEKIYNCVKTDSGVSLDWMDGKRKNPEHFTFPELEDMRIPVPDLIDDPVLFRIDLQEHKIYRSQIGRGSY